MTSGAGQVPSVGRTVHYVSYGTPGGEFTAQHRAAIITEVRQLANGIHQVKLCVLNPGGIFFSDWLEEDVCAERGGSWHWPERT